MKKAFCAAVDWGTTSFRIWLLGQQGEVLAMRRSTEGLTHCAPDRFSATLDAHLAAIGAPGDLPVVVCGMAGARQGWLEVPYMDAPAALEALVTGAVRVPAHGRSVHILPGICQRDPAAPDVMRGEETQLLGACGARTGALIACLPGSHSKWVLVEDGRIARLCSFMTGELYAAIGRHTILSHSLASQEGNFSQAAFTRSVERMLGAPQFLSAELFAIRAGHLLGQSSPADAPSTLSGLLIGAEIAAARAMRLDDRPLLLVASGGLSERYSHALALSGFAAEHVDAEAAVVAGLMRAAVALHSYAGSGHAMEARNG